MAVSDEHPALVHYTSFAGVNAILGSQTLWATHHRFLNDFQEGSLFRDYFIAALKPHIRNLLESRAARSDFIKRHIERMGGLELVVQNEAEAIAHAYYNYLVRDFYITSFCGTPKNSLTERAGLLSQWRGYGSDGGCALVFDTKKMEEMLEEESGVYLYMSGALLSVVYSHETNLPDDFKRDLKVLANDAIAILEATMDDRQKNLSLISFGEFARSMSRYKHWGFREEQEIRAVLLPGSFDHFDDHEIQRHGLSTKREKVTRFRERGGVEVPYIDLFEDLKEDLPIKRIIVGPHAEKENRVNQLRERLHGTGIEVYASEIPYVG